MADDEPIDIVASQTDDGQLLFHDPTPEEGAVDVGRWMRAAPESCVDLSESR
ncbi:hypothetical protein ACFPYI_21425 [Halomarina salina]|uniref:Uncharacterized protein n=1 Tax=Halomarina salina TaxID=1872699 RepID=A0ABD5RTL3_9EURY|nr:hypothetical protein [Halomarina salina]